MDKTQNNLELRNLLNDFFQDIDPDAIIGDNIANRIVDVHLAKIQKYLDSQIQQSNEKILDDIEFELTTCNYSNYNSMKDAIENSIEIIEQYKLERKDNE